ASIRFSTVCRLAFTEIWAVDFEFGVEPGENPEPVCLVAWELRSGRKLRLWRDEFSGGPPYPTSPDARPSKKTKCVTWSCAEDHGPTLSAKGFWTIAKA